MKTHLWNKLIETVKKEVVPALGCTEPVSVALAAAIGARKLSGKPVGIEVFVSPNLMKNGMGVGVPGTGMVGLSIAAAVGAVAGDPDAGLEVLKNITDAEVLEAKELLDRVSVELADVPNILFARVTLSSATEHVSVTIADSHTRVVSIEENGRTTYHEPAGTHEGDDSWDNELDGVVARDIYDFALNVPLEDIAFINQARELNKALSDEGLVGEYGLRTGKTFQRNVERGLLSHDLLTDVVMRTSAASDARMDGAMKPAMSNSGSGNQGITATMPVVVAAEYLKASDDMTMRALILSHLLAIYIKSRQNKLSALCGATTAAMGASAAITYLLGGNYQQMSHAVSSMIGDVSGMICDGAKPGCAMKVSSSAGAAVKAALMASDDFHVTGNEGVVGNDVETSIRNLCALANGAMVQTDIQILELMRNKH